MKALHATAFILVIIGGLNWLLIGIFSWGIANILPYGLTRVIYVLVGIAAVYLIFSHKSTCKMCEKGASMPPSSAPQM